MTQSPTILRELQEIGVKLPIAATPYELPGGYFDEFPNAILHSIQTDEVLIDLPTKTPFQLPSGYFTRFSSELQNNLFLHSLSKEMPYVVPDNYFDTLPATILQQVAPQPTLRVSSFKPKQWAIAATIALFLGVGFLLNNLSPSASSIEQQLSALPQHELTEYLETYQAEFDLSLATEEIDANNIDINRLEDEIISNQLNNIPLEELEKFIL